MSFDMGKACIFLNFQASSVPSLNFLFFFVHASSLQFFEVFIAHVWPKNQPNPNPSSWPLALSMIYFVVALCRGWDKRSLHVLMNMIVLEGKLWDLKVLHGYRNLCHYSYKISMSLCGHAWNMLSFIILFDAYFQKTLIVDWYLCGVDRSEWLWMGLVVWMHLSSLKR